MGDRRRRIFRPSNISTIHLVGLTASGYNEGLVWGNFEWMAAFTLILLSLVSLPSIFAARFRLCQNSWKNVAQPRFALSLAFMAITAALFIHIGMSIYAGAAVFEQFFGISVFASILIVAVVVSIYTILGGLRAVVVTETVNTGFLLVGRDHHYGLCASCIAGAWNSLHRRIQGRG